MATFYSGVAASVHMALKVTETGTSTNDNTSSISWSLIAWLDSTSSPWYSNASHDINVTINGSTVFSRASGTKVTVSVGTDHTSESNPVTIASGATTVAHNSDGTKSLAVSFNMVYKWNASYAWSASGSMALTQIARASQPSCITYPSTTQNVGDLGTKIYVHTNRASTSFTHTLRYSWCNLSGTIATNVGDNCQWTIPLNFANEIPTQSSCWGTIYCDTYYNGTLIGTKSVTFTATVPSSMKPTASIATSRPRTTATSVNMYVQNVDSIKVAVTASGQYGASITSISTSVNGISYSGSSFTTSVINNSGTISLTTTVTDSRGKTNTATSSVTFTAYSAPSVSASAYRCNSSGTADSSGAYMCIKITGSITALSNKNAKTCTVYYKKASDSSWTSKSITLSSYSVSQSTVVSADTTSTYNAKVDLADSFRTSEYYTSGISSASAFIDILTADESDEAKKTGLAIGKVAETEGAVDIGWDLILRSGVDWKGMTYHDVLPTANISAEYYSRLCKYVKIGCLAFVEMCIQVKSVSGTVPSEIQITLPDEVKFLDTWQPSYPICNQWSGTAILGVIKPVRNTSQLIVYPSSTVSAYTYLANGCYVFFVQK